MRPISGTGDMLRTKIQYSFDVTSENNKVNFWAGFKTDVTSTSWKINIYDSSKSPLFINAGMEFHTQILPYSVGDIQTASVTNTFTVLKYLPNSAAAQKPTILLTTVQMAYRSAHSRGTRVINHRLSPATGYEIISRDV